MKTPETKRFPYEDMPCGHEKAFEHTLNYIEEGAVFNLVKEKGDLFDDFSGLIIKRVHFAIFRHLLDENYDAERDNPDGDDDTIYLPIYLYINRDKKIRIASDLDGFNFMWKGYENQEDIGLYNDLFKYAYKRGSLLFNRLELIEKED